MDVFAKDRRRCYIVTHIVTVIVVQKETANNQRNIR